VIADGEGGFHACIVAAAGTAIALIYMTIDYIRNRRKPK